MVVELFICVIAPYLAIIRDAMNSNSVWPIVPNRPHPIERHMNALFGHMTVGPIVPNRPRPIECHMNAPFGHMTVGIMGTSFFL